MSPLCEPGRKRFARDAVLIVDGSLVPTRDQAIAQRSKNYRYSTNHQVVMDADTRPVVVVGRPLAGNRNDCKVWEESGAKAAVGKTLTIADSGYPGTGLAIAPAWSSRTAASAARANSRTGRRATASPTSRSAPASSTSSPA
ncbi:Transposase DDE domain protein [Streptomyces sp. IB2014 011-1]|nr:Transposase DDE domain protein [Streptomyces sp. IB2014 011-1]